MKAKKSLGQNFLKDPKILKKIADFARIEKEDTVVEVGPGKGSLTRFLLEKAGRVIAVEKDEELVEFLKEKFKKEILEGKLEIIMGDILKIKLEKSSVNEPSERDWRELEEIPSKELSVRENGTFFLADNYVLVGNIPYYITGEIFRKFLEYPPAGGKPKSITFVVQKEVADRIMARNGGESILSISIKAFGTPEYGGLIKAGSFVPKPKVDSAIIAVRNIGNEKISAFGEKKFFAIVKKGFAHKRKFLIKNLGVSRKLFSKCSIPEKARAENLSLENWICLVKNL